MATSGGSPSPSEGEREVAVSRIQEAFAQGAISHQDLELRLDSALTARTAEEVLAAVDSLPVLPGDRRLDIVATQGKISRDGEWRVPRFIRIESRFGKVRLDFSRAVFESSEVDVELQLQFGWAKVIAPDGAAVDLDGLRAAWKQPRHEFQGDALRGSPLIRITGSMEFGRLTVRHRR